MLAAISSPWYMNMSQVSVGTDITGYLNCTRTLFTSWQYQYCQATGNGCDSTEVKRLLCPNNNNDKWTNWRTQCDDNNNDCKHRAHVYDVSGAMCGFAFICCALLLLGFFIRCACSQHHKNSLMMAISILGLICLLVSIFYYETKLADSVKEDLDGKCPSNFWTHLNGPCDSFWGSDTYTMTLNLITVERVWMPFIGWYCAVSSIPLYLIVVCLSFKGQNASGANDYRKMGGKDTQYI